MGARVLKLVLIKLHAAIICVLGASPILSCICVSMLTPILITAFTTRNSMHFQSIQLEIPLYCMKRFCRKACVRQHFTTVRELVWRMCLKMVNALIPRIRLRQAAGGHVATFTSLGQILSSRWLATVCLQPAQLLDQAHAQVHVHRLYRQLVFQVSSQRIVRRLPRRPQIQRRSQVRCHH